MRCIRCPCHCASFTTTEKLEQQREGRDNRYAPIVHASFYLSRFLLYSAYGACAPANCRCRLPFICTEHIDITNGVPINMVQYSVKPRDFSPEPIGLVAQASATTPPTKGIAAYQGYPKMATPLRQRCSVQSAAGGGDTYYTASPIVQQCDDSTISEMYSIYSALAFPVDGFGTPRRIPADTTMSSAGIGSVRSVGSPVMASFTEPPTSPLYHQSSVI